MVMTITQLTTHWDYAEAHLVIEFLDELQDILWTAYGEEIIAMYQSEAERGAVEDNMRNDGQTELSFDDPIEF